MNIAVWYAHVFYGKNGATRSYLEFKNDLFDKTDWEISLVKDRKQMLSRYWSKLPQTNGASFLLEMTHHQKRNHSMTRVQYNVLNAIQVKKNTKRKKLLLPKMWCWTVHNTFLDILQYTIIYHTQLQYWYKFQDLSEWKAR